MGMRRVGAITLAAVFVANSAAPLAAQSSLTAWANVEALARETAVDVETRDGRKVRGKVDRATADTLVVLPVPDSTAAGPAQPVILSRAEIREVRRAPRSGRWWGLGIGAGVGFFLGFLGALTVAFRDCGESCGDERVLVGALLIGVPVAAGFT